MKLLIISTLLTLTSAFLPTSPVPASSTTLSATRAEIMGGPHGPETGKKVFDPLNLAESGSEETLNWFRHAEIKHGRVAMAAFTGWCVTGLGYHLPGDLAHGLAFADIPKGGLDAWAAVPAAGKAQMLLGAGLIEFHDELFASRRGTHYMRPGGVPGKNYVPGLFDPLNLSAKATAAKKEKGLVSELKNGRLAMIGIMGLVAEANIPGSVPLQPMP